MNVKTLAVYLPVLIWRQRNLVLYRLAVIVDLQVWIVDAVEFPEHLYKVGLTVNQSIDGQPGSFPEGSQSEMFQAEHALRFDEFAVELLQWQLRW
jgi:hypothetical protein